MEFYFFHLMPWPYLPADFDERYHSAWVDFPNTQFDPRLCHELYNRYLDELEYAERLGFDGVCVNEHHQNAYGLMPSPNVIASMLVRRTTKLKIALVGNGLPLRDHPLRVAEEVAMMDVISGGRIISAFVRGIGAEYHSFSLNPTYSRERFDEAHDLIIRAWTEPGPFRFEGKHYRFRHVNVWPRPLQQPHPPIWIPSQGSAESIEWAAAKRYPLMLVYSALQTVETRFDQYKAAAQAVGYTAPPEQLGWMVPVYLADTEARAMEAAEPHVLWLFHKGLKMPQHYFFPPGYLTERSQLAVGGRRHFSQYSFAEFVKEGWVIVGDPASVADQLAAHTRRLGCGILLALLQIGTMTHWETVRSLELFAREVMPRLQCAPPASTDRAGAPGAATAG